MKRLLLISLLGLLLVGFSTDEENQWIIIFTPWVQTNRIAELEIENNDLREQIYRSELELTESLGLVESYGDITSAISNLEAQKASITSNIGAIQATLFQAQAELTRVLASTASINAVIASVTPDMGTVGCRRFQGNSMEPTFYSTDLVCVSRDAGYLQTVTAGDIVIVPCRPYWAEGWFLIHRIVAEVGGLWQTQGDNNGSPDPCLNEKSSVTYKVTGIAKGVFN